MSRFTFESIRLPDTAEDLRQDVRRFLADEQAKGGFVPVVDSWLSGFNPDFSEKLGRMGWIGMVWPEKYGGHARSTLERYVVMEELLAAGAPVGAHWVADRQMGPMILRHGTEAQKERFLPDMAKGVSYWAIGMSEPNAGSDLSAAQAKLTPDGAGWRLSGQKLWSSGAHRCQYMIALCRSGPAGDDRHGGLTNVIIDLRDPAVTIRPIYLISGEHHFNEVIFNDVYISEDMVIGEPGDGWHQVTEELAHERSGPERFLSTMPLFEALVQVTQHSEDRYLQRELAALASELAALRQLSLSIAGILEQGGNPVVEAALVKDAGTRFERKVTEVAERVLQLGTNGEGGVGVSDEIAANSGIAAAETLLAQAILHGPGFTIRGGTNEILRGIVARGLGLR
ncbi:acyl-CoA dehydrogenase family protein [Alicyclobacillus cycloheptanicus]|uniref:Alkylation response protein AidB-like acyl-CoA dehydrogenase n=1 Tax=Alicyclobacillus cycloheptanicus TaxID=1457 RepID=A0ABT9XFI7_9BACL|nr:acyl-CoA dehydrogenase family protein [Alicyclobacillus cycloheptanicus]MDQ0189030.1 alkylation response protein AidB-like acyl-CoA dehydrogenase [Alicyclobacillus cycloheptanicus]WDM00168.1 acyl-CoA dehydrogenase family protein [Alicyclobacillus cycloheptanicus]